MQKVQEQMKETSWDKEVSKKNMSQFFIQQGNIRMMYKGMCYDWSNGWVTAMDLIMLRDREGGESGRQKRKGDCGK